MLYTNYKKYYENTNYNSCVILHFIVKVLYLLYLFNFNKAIFINVKSFLSVSRVFTFSATTATITATTVTATTVTATTTVIIILQNISISRSFLLVKS